MIYQHQGDGSFRYGYLTCNKAKLTMKAAVLSLLNNPARIATAHFRKKFVRFPKGRGDPIFERRTEKCG